MNKWLNKQKPITLGFITAMLVFILLGVLAQFVEEVINLEQIIKFNLAVSVLMFFMSWLLFSMGEKSSIIFDEITELYTRAKKAKTKTEMIIVESDYRILRKKCQHQNHYTRMNEIWQIIETKNEFL